MLRCLSYKNNKNNFLERTTNKKENLFSPVPRALLLLFTARSVFLLFFFVFLRRETKGKEYNADVCHLFFPYTEEALEDRTKLNRPTYHVFDTFSKLKTLNNFLFLFFGRDLNFENRFVTSHERETRERERERARERETITRELESCFSIKKTKKKLLFAMTTTKTRVWGKMVRGKKM